MATPYEIQGYANKVAVQQPQLDSFQDYQDAAWKQSRRYLDPQQASQDRKFAQTMINKGLAPGSAAYQTAMDNYKRTQNDANAGAAFQAMQFGQNAQNQSFQQGLGASQLANAIARANLQAETARENAALAANTQRYGIDVNAEIAANKLAQQGSQFQDTLGFQQSQWGDQLGLQRDKFGFEQSRWDDQFGLQRDQFGELQNQNTFNNMLGLGNFGINYGNYLNNSRMTDYNMAAAMLSNAPGSQQQQLNVGGAYNTAQQGAMNQAGLWQNAAQMMWSGVGDIAGAAAFLSGIAYKTLNGKLKGNNRAKLVGNMLSMPIYEWEYLPEYMEKNDHPYRFGPLAEDFNRGILGKSQRVKDMDTIDVQRYVAALHTTIQDMSHEIERIEALLWFVANRTGMPLDRADHISHQGKKAHEQKNSVAKDSEHWMTEIEIAAQEGTAREIMQ